MTLNTQLALVDIETTGGRTTRDSITEIAVIIVSDGGEVNRWQTLVNPHCYIPQKIQNLTGITNEMVRDAPSFDDIAVELYDLLKDKLFVAHNARFDYGFIKNHFNRAGYLFQSKVLCTVRLSRKLYPAYKSHSMDRLIERHDLKPLSRHRAMGDADLIKQFMDVCYGQFGRVDVEVAIKQLIKQSALPSYLETDISTIPNTPGVYLFYNDKDSLPIYIGKSINMRTRVLSHFSSDYTSTKEHKIATQTKYIEFIETAGELGALLLESKLIKQKMPIYNRKLRRTKRFYRLVLSDKDNINSIKITSTLEYKDTCAKDSYGCFRSKKAAEQALEALVSKNQLCPKFCGLDKSKGCCFSYQVKKCRGVCCNQEPAVLYNLRLRSALIKYQRANWPYSGVIGVREFCENNGKMNIHLLNNWMHLCTLTTNDELSEIELENLQPTDANHDETKILISQLLNKVPSRDIITLTGGSLR